MGMLGNTPTAGTISGANIQDGTVDTADIADGAITTVKIADANVTTAKVANGAITTAKITDANVTTAKIADAAVTYAKMQSVSAGKVLGRNTSSSGVVQELPIAVDSSGNVTVSGAAFFQGGGVNNPSAGAGNINLQCTNASTPVNGYVGANAFYNNYWALGSASNHPVAIVVNGSPQAIVDTNYNFKFNSGYGSAATAYGCRAWANFNGETSGIRGSGGISSVSRIAAGVFQLNFAVAMPDTNYALGGTATERSAYSGGSSGLVLAEYKSGGSTYGAKTTTALQVCTVDNGGDQLYDSWSCNPIIFR